VQGATYSGRCSLCLVATAAVPPSSSLRWRARHATSCVCIGCDGFARLSESALSAGRPKDPGSPDRDRGRRHRREAAAPDPANRRWNLPGRRALNSGSERRLERGVRVLCPALHAHVAGLRCMRRWANRLTGSLVEMSERRAGRHTKGQARCRSHREDSLPHRLAPSAKDTCIRLCTPSGGGEC
jgi:hypothetical protein